MSAASEHVLRNMQKALRRAQAAYEVHDRLAARYWLGACAMLHLLAQDLRLNKKMSMKQVDTMIEFTARGRSIFEELDLGNGTVDLGAVERAYPDEGARVLDHFMAQCGM